MTEIILNLMQVVANGRCNYNTRQKTDLQAFVILSYKSITGGY
ncbi:hypothetical protein [Petrimonas sp.]